MKITVEQSNNKSNDQWRKDNMTYILQGEGEAYIITILSIIPLIFQLIPKQIGHVIGKKTAY